MSSLGGLLYNLISCAEMSTNGTRTRRLIGTRKATGRCNARLKFRSKDGRSRYCAQPAGADTEHPGIGRCNKHGGNGPRELKRAGVRLAHKGIMDPSVQPGQIVQIEPTNALIWSVWLAAGDVAYWTAVLQRDDPENPKHPDAFKHQREANRLMRQAAKMALDAGLAERQVALAERMVNIVAIAIGRVLDALDLSPDQKDEVPSIIQEVLRSMEAPGAPIIGPRPKHATINYRPDELVVSSNGHPD